MTTISTLSAARAPCFTGNDRRRRRSYRRELFNLLSNSSRSPFMLLH